jgi:hypothetical protein
MFIFLIKLHITVQNISVYFMYTVYKYRSLMDLYKLRECLEFNQFNQY